MPFASAWSFLRIYQAGLSFFLHVVLGIVVAILIHPSRTAALPHEYVLSSLILGEILLPPVVGWIASGVVLRDPMKEVILATPYPQTRLTLKRLLTHLASALTVWLAFLIFFWQLAERPQLNLLKLGLGAGLPAMLLFGATGLWGSLRLGTWTGGGICVTLLWGSGLVFRQTWLSLPLFYPFLTYFAAESSEHPAWWANRVLLCIVSGVLIFDACRLVDNEELLLSADREDA